MVINGKMLDILTLDNEKIEPVKVNPVQILIREFKTSLLSSQQLSPRYPSEKDIVHLTVWGIGVCSEHCFFTQCMEESFTLTITIAIYMLGCTFVCPTSMHQVLNCL